MKKGKASIFTKLVVLIVGVWAVAGLFTLNARIDAASAKRAELANLAAQKAAKNATLESIIARRDDPDILRDVARDKLGLVMLGEIIFYDIGG